MTELQQTLTIIRELLPGVEDLLLTCTDRGTYLQQRGTDKLYIQLDNENRVVVTSGELDDHFPVDEEALQEWMWETDVLLQVRRIEACSGWPPDKVDRVLQKYIDRERTQQLGRSQKVQMEALFRVRKLRITELEQNLKTWELE